MPLKMRLHNFATHALTRHPHEYAHTQVMLPPNARGTISYIAPAGHYTVNDEVIEIEFQGQKRKYSMKQLWPVRGLRRVCSSFAPVSWQQLAACARSCSGWSAAPATGPPPAAAAFKSADSHPCCFASTLANALALLPASCVANSYIPV